MAEDPDEPAQKADQQKPEAAHPQERKSEPENMETVREDVEVEDRFQGTDN